MEVIEILFVLMGFAVTALATYLISTKPVVGKKGEWRTLNDRLDAISRAKLIARIEAMERHYGKPEIEEEVPEEPEPADQITALWENLPLPVKAIINKFVMSKTGLSVDDVVKSPEAINGILEALPKAIKPSEISARPPGIDIYKPLDLRNPETLRKLAELPSV